jgi:hypothetical protein
MGKEKREITISQAGQIFARSRLHPESIPANSEALSSTSNGIQERGNSAPALCGHLARTSDNGVGVNRMPAGRGIVSEAKVCGKATG